MTPLISPRIQLGDRTRAAAFDDLEPAALETALSWFEHGPRPEDQVLKAGRVWRHGNCGVKFFPRRGALRNKLRRSRARLCADLHFALAPVPTPRPLLVLENDSGESLLVYEFVEGQFLDGVWESDAAAVAAFPHFLADMHRRQTFHGDFHLRNFVWNGQTWVLLDLDSVRPALHFLRWKSLIFDHWGRVHLGLQGARGLKNCFRQYLSSSGLGWDSEWAWARVLTTSARLARQRGLDTSYALKSGPDGARLSPAKMRVLELVTWFS
jgi:hypothetical protein